MTTRADPSFDTFNDGSFTRIPCKPAWFHDSCGSFLTNCQNHGYQYFGHGAFPRVIVTTTATTIRVESVNDTLALNGFNSAIKIDGVPQGNGNLTPTVGGNGTITTYSGLAPGLKTIELIDGPRSNLGFGLLPHGCPTIAFYIPAGSSWSIVMPTAPTHRIGVDGDSITVGEEVTSGAHQSACFGAWPMLMRANALASGSGPFAGASVTVDASGWGRLWDIFGSTAQLNDWLYRLSGQMNGTAANRRVIDLGTNDYGSGISAAQLSAVLGPGLDAAHAAFPALDFVLSTPRTRLNETVVNAGGSNLPDLRTVIVAAQAARSGWIQLLNGPAMNDFPSDFYIDGLHLLTSGAPVYESRARATIGY